jgi:hypothetical protein
MTNAIRWVAKRVAFEHAVEEIGEQTWFRDFNLRGFIASDNGVDYGIVKFGAF